MATQRIAPLIDVAAAVAMFVAASLVIWQAWAGGAADPPSDLPPATESIEDQGLSMSLTDAFSQGNPSAPIEGPRIGTAELSSNAQCGAARLGIAWWGEPCQT